MLVKNVSARLHHVGNVAIAPGESKEIDNAFASAINPAELEAVKAGDAGETPAKRGRPAKVTEPEAEAE